MLIHNHFAQDIFLAELPQLKLLPLLLTQDTYVSQNQTYEEKPTDSCMIFLYLYLFLLYDPLMKSRKGMICFLPHIRSSPSFISYRIPHKILNNTSFHSISKTTNRITNIYNTHKFLRMMPSCCSFLSLLYKQNIKCK